MGTSASIPEELQALHKAASAYAIATRKADVEGESISDATMNEIEHALDVECFNFSQADHRNSDFVPFAFVKLIEQLADAKQESDDQDNLREKLDKCLRCERRIELPLPMPLSVWLAAVKAFLKLHRGCKKK